MCWLRSNRDCWDVEEHPLIFHHSKDNYYACLHGMMIVCCTVCVVELGHGLHRGNLHVPTWEQWDLHDLASKFFHQNFHSPLKCSGTICNYYAWHILRVSWWFNYHWDFIFSWRIHIVIMLCIVVVEGNPTLGRCHDIDFGPFYMLVPWLFGLPYVVM